MNNPIIKNKQKWSRRQMGHKKSSQNLNFEAKEMILIDKYEAKRV
jgi:hypothetical protein